MAKSDLPKLPRNPARKKILLTAEAGEAREVVFTGDFTGWSKDKVRLTKSPNGDWTGTIELAPGEYQYRLLVDGQWRDDPAAKSRVPNEFGTSNCILKVT